MDTSGTWKRKKLERIRTWRAAKQVAPRQPLECARTKLMEVMSNATREDWAFLADFESLRDNLNVYNHTSRSVVKAGCLVPWPIIWLLTRFNRKHRFCATAKPEIESIRKSLAVFDSQIKWKWWFHHHPDLNPRCQRVRGLPAAPCPHVIPHELSTWLSFLRSAIFKAVRSGSSHSISARPSRIPFLVKWACRLMRDLQVVGIPNDKEYGFSLEAVEVQSVIHAEILSSSSYLEISPSEVVVSNIAERYSKLCFRIGKFEGNTRMGSSMSRTLGVPGSSLGTTLITTIKTHKGNGFIEHRNIHAAACPKLRGLSSWVTQVLDEQLRLLPHLLLSSEDFVQRLSSVRVDADDRLIRIDLSHFLCLATWFH